MINNNSNSNNNFNYIKNMILKNENNYNYIIDLASSYIKNNPKNRTENMELSSLMYEILPEDEPYKYQFYLNAITNLVRFKAETEIKRDISIKEKIGLGFIYAEMNYKESPKKMEYIAKAFIDEIFNDKNTKDLINNANFDQSEINTSLINIIYLYDKILADYTAMNINVLDNIKGKIFENLDKTIKQ